MLNADCRSAVGIARELAGNARPMSYNFCNTLVGRGKFAGQEIGPDIRLVVRSMDSGRPSLLHLKLTVSTSAIDPEAGVRGQNLPEFCLFRYSLQ